MLAQGPRGHHRHRQGRVLALTGRAPTTLLGLVGALGAGIGGTVAEAPEVSGVGWAALAGFGLSLMLHGVGLRVLGVALVLLAVLGSVVSLVTVWWMLFGFLLVAAAGVAMVAVGPSWASQRRKRPPSKDPWKLMDDGDDPTVDPAQ